MPPGRSIIFGKPSLLFSQLWLPLFPRIHTEDFKLCARWGGHFTGRRGCSSGRSHTRPWRGAACRHVMQRLTREASHERVAAALMEPMRNWGVGTSCARAHRPPLHLAVVPPMAHGRRHGSAPIARSMYQPQRTG